MSGSYLNAIEETRVEPDCTYEASSGVLGDYGGVMLVACGEAALLDEALA